MTLTCTNVTLRQKPLRNDRISLYLDYYPAIRNPYTMKMSRREFLGIYIWKSHATLTLLATQDLPTFGYNMIDPLKSWCWGSILFYPFKISRFS